MNKRPEDYESYLTHHCFIEGWCATCFDPCDLSVQFQIKDMYTVFVYQDEILYGALTLWANDSKSGVKLAESQVGNFLPIFNPNTHPEPYIYRFVRVIPTLWPGAHPERTTGVQTWFPVGEELVDFTQGENLLSPGTKKRYPRSDQVNSIGEEVSRAWSMTAILGAAMDTAVAETGLWYRKGAPPSRHAGRKEAVDILTDLYTRYRHQAEVLQKLCMKYADPGEM